MDQSRLDALASLRQAMAEGALKSNLRTQPEDITRPYRELMNFYRCAIMEVETKFRVLNAEFSLNEDNNPIASIQSRLKSPESIMEKLERYQLPFTLESLETGLNDIAGVRVICSFQSDIYMLAEALLKQDDVTLLQKKDYIAHPKPNGYRSLHLIITTPIFLHDQKKMMRVEVQLRTIAMDMWANQEHQIRYKKEDRELPESANADLLKCAELSAEVDRIMQSVHDQVFHDGQAGT